MSEHNHTEQDFEEFYAEGPRWSGNPNGTLVREVTGMSPGTALDVGCGEGSDVAWLASQGWQVTGIDPVEAAVQRAQELVDARELNAELHVTGILGFAATGRTFDLVSCFYCPLPDTQELAEALMGLVSPGGTLLFVHHAFEGEMPELLTPEGVDKHVQFPEASLTRVERHVSHGAGAHHHEDVVYRGKR